MNTNTSLPNPVREDGLVLDSIYIADRSDLPSYSHYYPEVTLNLALTEDLLTLIVSIDICVRTSPREGTVIARKGSGVSSTFTVRRVSYGVGVERVFPVHSPSVAKVELVRKGQVRRAKLYYLRDRVGKAAKVKELIG